MPRRDARQVRGPQRTGVPDGSAPAPQPAAQPSVEIPTSPSWDERCDVVCQGRLNAARDVTGLGRGSAGVLLARDGTLDSPPRHRRVRDDSLKIFKKLRLRCHHKPKKSALSR